MDAFIKLIADGSILAIVAIAAYALIFRVSKTGRYDTYTRIFMAGITSYGLAKFVGSIWQPEELRPFEKLGIDPGAAYLDNPGFPSDHMLFAMFLVFAVWYGTRNKWIAGVMLGLAIVMGVGRVLALVHTPLDIVGGIVAAGLGAVWYLSAIPKKPFHKRLAKNSKK